MGRLGQAKLDGGKERIHARQGNAWSSGGSTCNCDGECEMGAHTRRL